MKFSILVPVYNVEKYLEQCVEALLSQTYTGDYEIILVDDGSTDSSSQLCDEFAHKNPDKIRVIHKVNEGLLSARDVGIVEAQGKYCLFVDSDDFVEENLLQVVAEEIEKNNQPDMVIYSFQYYDNGKVTQRKVDFPDKVYGEKEKSYFYESLISSPVFKSLWTKAVKTELLKNDPNDYSKYYGKDMGEDWLRSLHIFTEANSIVCRNVPLYNYRANQSSISKSFHVEKIGKQNMCHVYEQILKYLPLWGMYDSEHIEKLKENWVKETIYTFSNFYENAKNNKQRKMIVDYDWASFEPEALSIEQLKNTESIQYKLYSMIKQKRCLLIRVHFIKKLIYKKYKNLKSRL